MSLQVIYELLQQPVTWGVISVAVLSLIEITPIKLNPWSWLAKMIGRAFNKEVLDHIRENDKKTDQISKDLALLKGEIERKSAVEARTHILHFDDEIYNGMKHSKESFIQQLSEIDTYERYCADNPDFENSCAVEAIKHIRNVYQTCLSEHKFI